MVRANGVFPQITGQKSGKVNICAYPNSNFELFEPAAHHRVRTPK
jgi:hypothetical protein